MQQSSDGCHKDGERSLLSQSRILSPERAAWHPVTCLVMFLIHLFINTCSWEEWRGGGGGQWMQLGGSRSLGLCLREADEGAHRLSGLRPGTVSSKIGAAAWHKDLRKQEDSLEIGARSLEEVREGRLWTWPEDASGFLLLFGVWLRALQLTCILARCSWWSKTKALFSWAGYEGRAGGRWGAPHPLLSPPDIWAWLGMAMPVTKPSSRTMVETGV